MVCETVLKGIEDGRIRTVAIERCKPSLFSHEILNANPYAFLDDAPLEERRTRAVQLRQTLGTDVTGGEGVLDPAAIDQISAESWPEARDADELHDALLTLVRMPPAAEWQAFFNELAGSSTCFDNHARTGRHFGLRPSEYPLPTMRTPSLRGWMDSLGPATVSALAGKLAFPSRQSKQRSCVLKPKAKCFGGIFAVRSAVKLEWCNRRILARIHRATLGRLRREIEPGHGSSTSNASCRLGSMFRPEANCTAQTARSKSYGSCKDMKSPPPHGNRKFSRRDCKIQSRVAG